MNPLEWNEAQHKARIIQEEKKAKALQKKKEQEKNMELAADELWNALGTEGFRYSYFEDICIDYGLDEEDLLDRII